MSWEEKLLFLMFLDYKGVLEKWEKNHNEDKNGFDKIDSNSFTTLEGFEWASTKEGDHYWDRIILQAGFIYGIFD